MDYKDIYELFDNNAKHRIKKLDDKIFKIEKVLKLLNDETVEQQNSFRGMKTRRDELKRLVEVVGDETLINDYKEIDKHFTNAEKSIGQNIDKLSSLTLKKQKLENDKMELIKQTVSDMIAFGLKASGDDVDKLLEIRREQIAMEKKHKERKIDLEQIVRFYTNFTGEFYPISRDKLILVFNPGTQYGEWITR